MRNATPAVGNNCSGVVCPLMSDPSTRRDPTARVEPRRAIIRPKVRPQRTMAFRLFSISSYFHDVAPLDRLHERLQRVAIVPYSSRGA
jgi:hypothetical protein